MNFYIRLLTYDEACKVIDFTNKYDRGNNDFNVQDVFANVTPGGVSVKVGNSPVGNSTENETEIKDQQALVNIIKYYVEVNFKRFEFTEDAPWKVEQQIVGRFKAMEAEPLVESDLNYVFMPLDDATIEELKETGRQHLANAQKVVDGFLNDMPDLKPIDEPYKSVKYAGRVIMESEASERIGKWIDVLESMPSAFDDTILKLIKAYAITVPADQVPERLDLFIQQYSEKFNVSLNDLKTPNLDMNDVSLTRPQLVPNEQHETMMKALDAELKGDFRNDALNKYSGGYVKEPTNWKTKWNVPIDFASLYGFPRKTLHDHVIPTSIKPNADGFHNCFNSDGNPILMHPADLYHVIDKYNEQASNKYLKVKDNMNLCVKRDGTFTEELIEVETKLVDGTFRTISYLSRFYLDNPVDEETGKIDLTRLERHYTTQQVIRNTNAMKSSLILNGITH